jgi:hypothetical protein
MLSCVHMLFIQNISLQKIEVNIEQKSAKTVRTKKSTEYISFTLFIGGLEYGHIPSSPFRYFLLQSGRQIHLRSG